MRILLAASAFLLMAATFGFSSSNDADGDGLDDALEQMLLKQFTPRFWIAESDCDVKPAEFAPGVEKAAVTAQNGTIYGQAFPVVGAVELHYYHLWGRDCGRMSHDLDAEHVSVLLVQEGSRWRARYWYAAAHEDTLCDRGSAARAFALGAEWTGAEVWVSRGKHASFLTEKLCRMGCGSDRCDRSVKLEVKQIVNLGEACKPLNGAVWVKDARWPLESKMTSDFPSTLMSKMDRSKKVVKAETPNYPGQALALAGSQTADAMNTANEKTEGALVKARQSVKDWVKKRLDY